ncbi:hypothetical protein PsYK624_081860 [Phanerochaete sordida]|uniref:Fungal-type protein kinase domain-containing protein n=1 Tax=Phanerochaete sordida TaxID=48140 RepID=A0A9P3GBW4_9APHY|nr:hypothetical protein PsYK624_081860 [Phanerochaete sordida]
MYKPWAEATLSVLPDDVTLAIPSEGKCDGLHPSIVFQLDASKGPASQSQNEDAPLDPSHFGMLDIACDVKFSHLPFLSCRRKELVESLEMKEGGIARGRLAYFAAKQLQQQHRVCVWQVILSKTQAHLIRWDRSGAVVSEGFNPTREPWILHLLLVYSQASRQQQGFDRSAHLLSGPSDLRKTFVRGIRECKSWYHDRELNAFSSIDLSETSNWPLYKLEVPDDKAPGSIRACLVSQPFYMAHSPLGRGTRVYVAYDLLSRKIRILKDAWRPQDTSYLPEYVACARLVKEGVEHAAKFICGGDIANGPGDHPQTTITQELATGIESASWRLPCAPMPVWKTFVHYRILEEMALPLESLENSCQLLIVIRDIVKAIVQAHSKARLLHRDITWFNLRWFYNPKTKRIEGVLIDWDHVEDIDQAVDVEAPNISATWHFMPLRLIDDPRKNPELIDTLESLFWSLLYGALHFVSHDQLLMLFGEGDLFGLAPTTFDDISLKKEATYKRRDLLNGRLERVQWMSDHFTEFMHNLCGIWRRYYLQHDAVAAKVLKDESELTQLHSKLSDGQWLIDQITRAIELDCEGWPLDDIVSDQFPKLTPREVDTLKNAVRTSHNNVSHMSIDQRTELVAMPTRYDTQRTDLQMVLDTLTCAKRSHSTMQGSDDEELEPNSKRTRKHDP